MCIFLTLFLLYLPMTDWLVLLKLCGVLGCNQESPPWMKRKERLRMLLSKKNFRRRYHIIMIDYHVIEGQELFQFLTSIWGFSLILDRKRTFETFGSFFPSSLDDWKSLFSNTSTHIVMLLYSNLFKFIVYLSFFNLLFSVVLYFSISIVFIVLVLEITPMCLANIIFSQKINQSILTFQSTNLSSNVNLCMLEYG